MEVSSLSLEFVLGMAVFLLALHFGMRYVLLKREWNVS